MGRPPGAARRLRVRGATAASGQPTVSEVRFADPLDGWAFGPELFATHDGARTWQPVDLGGSITSLETSGGYVDAVVSSCTGATGCSGPQKVEQAPARGGGFVTMVTGPSATSSGTDELDLVLHAPAGFALLGSGSLYATGNLADPKAWNPLPDPCASAGLGLQSFAAPDTTTLYGLCTGGAAAGSATKTVVVTRNGKSAVAGSTPFGGDGDALAATSSGTVVVSAVSGASWLYRSADGGHTWSTVQTFGDGGMGFTDLGFTTSTQGVVIHGILGPPAGEVTQLLMTHDAGASWHVVTIR